MLELAICAAIEFFMAGHRSDKDARSGGDADEGRRRARVRHGHNLRAMSRELRAMLGIVEDEFNPKDLYIAERVYGDLWRSSHVTCIFSNFSMQTILSRNQFA